MLLGLPEALPHLVEARYKAAKASQAVVFSPTELAIIHTSRSIPFQLRYCPSLARKPQPPKNTTPAPKVDVFATPEPDLFIADVPDVNPSHCLLLNKFPIIPNHFIIATKENKPQTNLLEEADLAATYACLNAWEASRQKRLFAFFNSGPYSGASQPHRHLQLMPVDDMHGTGESAGWDLLLDLILSGEQIENNILQHPGLPFFHFAHKFNSEPSDSQLLQIYVRLYQLAKKAADDYITSHPGQLALHSTTDGNLPISYNLAMTTAGMAIFPRRSEGHMLRGEDGTDIGYVQLNGTSLGGSLMVKYEEEWNTLRREAHKLDLILEAIGIPKPAQTT
ncbi:Ap4A phosphorylase-like protein II [Byssothecium circinans]|uniref:Ap4A phosphorylase-like protein II n=1 Tax=Byssothecium circinans TaxID=147558 RepID=A0A6A5U4Y8_9PLEO|nr:Ap4A phosphorylase-like protein II [Byssothecium circinans]KAF1959019.1 Ap4A phosphorylase-like protein II [Byssothecium circinans]